jgi:hypothetical protein
MLRLLLITFAMTCCLVGFLGVSVAWAQPNPSTAYVEGNKDGAPVGFVPLVGIPFMDTAEIRPDFADYVNNLYRAAITIAALLAVIRIIFAGFQYMLSDIVTQKTEARKSIKNALLGLLIVIGAVLILETINPNLIKITSLSNLKGMVGELGGVEVLVPEVDIQLDFSDRINLQTSTKAEIADAIARCDTDNGYVWNQRKEGIVLYGECVRSNEQLSDTDYSGDGTLITSAKDREYMNKTCHNSSRPYIETSTSNNTTVGYCGAPCTPQESFSQQDNRCVPYTETNPNVDCAYTENQKKYPEECLRQSETVQIGDYTYRFEKINSYSVKLDCNNSIDVDYTTSCIDICSQAKGKLGDENVCIIRR